MSEMAKRVLEGRISEILLTGFSGWELVQSGGPNDKFPGTSTHSDEWETTVPRTKPGVWNENVCTDHALKVEDGIEVEKIINNFQDYFLTTINELCPIDSTKEKRDPSTLFNYSTIDTLHPCSLNPNNYFDNDNSFNSVSINAELYQSVVYVVEIHNCNSYCFRKKRRKKKKPTMGLLRWC